MPLVRQLHRGFEAKVSGLHERRRGGLQADCEMTAFLDGSNDEFGTDRQGAPPQSLSPYPQGVIHPLQTSVICNGCPLHTPLFSILHHLLGASLHEYLAQTMLFLEIVTFHDIS